MLPRPSGFATATEETAPSRGKLRSCRDGCLPRESKLALQVARKFHILKHTSGTAVVFAEFIGQAKKIVALCGGIVECRVELTYRASNLLACEA
jgi:hypothetical protein